MHFADTLVVRMRELGHPLCAGLDPHLDRFPPLFRRGSMQANDPETPAVVEELMLAFIERLAGRVAVIKPQIAFFEQMGSRGLAALERITAHARDRGLFVLLDAKRGDIGSTADGYARAYLEPGAPCESHALTLNPYLGLDTLRPFVERAGKYGRGLFILARTSNPGSADYQEKVLDGGDPLYQVVAKSLSPICDEMVGPSTGWSSVGIVAGATYPEQAEKLRTLLPNALFLVPGYGAQGGGAAEAMRGFVSGPSGREGGLINSSRGLLFPEAARSAESAEDWENAIDESLLKATDELANEVAR
ncbi:MAG: orotidine-5'-phosphate decarboxylase [Deltaproteobacteria bacterium]|nr:orotidine-5'-phosphate decarboxylase [Deltaproteobacteria bacterium]